MERNFRYLAIVLTIAITIGSLISPNNLIKPSVQVSDKFVHTTAYFILTLSWLLSFRLVLRLMKQLILILFIVFIYGIIIEVMQEIFTSYREADYYDILANFIGISIAGIAFYFIFQKNQMN